MRAGRAIRRAVLARIKDQVSEFGGRVFDKATEDEQFPYVTLGPSYWTDDSVECIEGRSYVLQVDIWASGGATQGKGNAEDLTDDVATALNGWMDQDAVTAHPARVTLVRVMDDPSGCVHGVVTVEVDVEG